MRIHSRRAPVKLELVLQLLQRHRAEGHRTLVFSQSKKMLNVIAAVLRAHGFRHRYRTEYRFAQSYHVLSS